MKKLMLLLAVSFLFIQCSKKEEKVEPVVRGNFYFRIVNASSLLGTVDIYQYYYNVLSKISDSLYFSKSIPEYQYTMSQLPDPKDENGNPEFAYYVVKHPSSDTSNYLLKIESPNYDEGKHYSLFLYDDKYLLLEDDVSFSKDSTIKIRLVNLDPNVTPTATLTSNSDPNFNASLSAGYLQASPSIEVPVGEYTANVNNVNITINSKPNKYLQIIVTSQKTFLLR